MDYWNDSLLSLQLDQMCVFLLSALIDTLSTKANNHLFIIYDLIMVWTKRICLDSDLFVDNPSKKKEKNSPSFLCFDISPSIFSLDIYNSVLFAVSPHVERSFIAFTAGEIRKVLKIYLPSNQTMKTNSTLQLIVRWQMWIAVQKGSALLASHFKLWVGLNSNYFVLIKPH